MQFVEEISTQPNLRNVSSPLRFLGEELRPALEWQWHENG
jgi:hypothetical protein